MPSQFVLITGANRGLGLGLLERFLAQPETTVIAAVRNPAGADFSTVKKGSGSKVLVVKYDASVEESASSVAEELQQKHKIPYLDIVVANAGIAKVFLSVREVKRADIQEHIEVNVYGVLSLYQATYELLKASPNKPVFAPVGSSAGTLSRQPNIPNAAYGASKAILPWYAVRMNVEEQWLNTFVLDPGWVQTEMGNSGAAALGVEKPSLTIDESCDGMYKVLTTGTRETIGGKVVVYTGEIPGW